MQHNMARPGVLVVRWLNEVKLHKFDVYCNPKQLFQYDLT